MSWKNRDPGERGYHHGNLREALIEAALSLIGQKGPAGFTFAEAARAAGVSPAAPYRHFRDRDALMANVAQQGFERFEGMLANAWSNGRPDPLTAFGNVGKAYLHFAGTEHAYYAAMFESGVPPNATAELQAAADRAFGVLRKAAETLCGQAPAGMRPPALMVSLHVWAMAHGTASLFARGDSGRRRVPMSAEELLEASVLIYLQGLGLAPKPS